MELSQNKILQAFDVYARLAARGELQKQEAVVLWEDDEVRHLVENFARHVQCIIIDDAENYYLIPLSMESPFHISNETFKRKYMPAKAINMDMYLLYLAVIVLFGCFYDSYQTSDPAEFVTMARWLEQMDYCIDSLKHQDEEVLRQKEKEFNYNWLALVRKWTDMDSLKETVRRQDSRTNSRLSFLNMTKDFLVSQHLIHELGNQELQLTEKARIIIHSYYMNSEYNRGIMDFMYNLDHQPSGKEETHHAVNQ